MKKHQSEYLKQQRCGRKEISQSICAIIEQDNHRHPAVVPRQVKPTRWRAFVKYAGNGQLLSAMTMHKGMDSKTPMRW